MKRELAALLLLGCIGCGNGAGEPPLPTVDFDQTIEALALPEGQSGQSPESPPLARVLLAPSLMLVSDEPVGDDILDPGARIEDVRVDPGGGGSQRGELSRVRIVRSIASRITSSSLGN